MAVDNIYLDLERDIDLKTNFHYITSYYLYGCYQSHFEQDKEKQINVSY